MMKLLHVQSIVLSLLLTSLLLTTAEPLIPAPLGTLVRVNGIKLHLLEMGQSHHTTPTIILDTFLGGNCLEWSLVQPAVAQFAHVCSYDRAGFGWSEASSEPRTSSCIVQELRALLQHAGITPPYILVGHSSGGINMQLFANLYPEEVYALILVDSSHEAQKDAIQVLRDRFALPIDYYARAKHDLSWLPTHLHKLYQQLQAKPTTAETTACERQFFGASLQEVAHSVNQLTEKPLIVITRGTKTIDQAAPEWLQYEKEFHNLWLQFQHDFLSKSKQSTQIVAQGSGHMVQRDRPDVIIEAIRGLITQYEQMA